MLSDAERAELIAEFRRPMEATFLERTPASQKMAAGNDAAAVANGARAVPRYGPAPIYVAKARGTHIEDVDGNHYIDFGNSATALIHGHANPKIEEAIVEAYRTTGTGLYPFPSYYHDKLAAMIVERMPGVDKVQYSLSGTESDMYAVRIARGYTGRDKILWFRGGYHGSYDAVHAVDTPSKGYPKSVEQDIVLADYNDRASVEEALAKHRGEIAAVLVEPVLGTAGYIEQRHDFLQFLRDITLREGVLLIFDEVVTGFRWAMGGATEYYNITPAPDLVVMAKVMGGGLAAGAVGGSAEVMEVLEVKPGRPPVYAGGTYSGNPVSCAAGIACLEQLTPGVYERLNRLGGRLRDGFRATFAELGVNAHVSGDASVGSPHMTNQDVVDAATAATATPELNNLLRLGLINRGVIWSSGGMSINTVTTEAEVDQAIDALRGTVIEMRPLLERVFPELMN